MNIITTLPTDDSAVKRALIKEIQCGFEFIKANEKRTELKAAQEAHQIKNHRTINGLGKCVAMFPPDEFFRLCRKFGRREVMSNDFMRYYRRKFPDLCPNRA